MADLEDLSFILDAASNMRGLRRDMRVNAEAHKAVALNPVDPTTGEPIPVATLAATVQSRADAYETRLGWQAAIWADANLKALVMTLVTAIGGTQAGVVAKYQNLKSAADALSAAPKTTFDEIIAACDALLANVTPQNNVWPAG